MTTGPRALGGRMAKPPMWRQAFDKVERLVATTAEAALRSEQFADAGAAAVKAASPVARAPIRLPSAAGAVEWVGGQVDRALHRTRNGVRFVTGFDAPAIAQSPKDVVWERDRATLYRYQSAQRRQATPVLLSMSLVSTPKVFDLRPRASFVAYLLQAGFDVFLLDWGIADERDAGNGIVRYVDDYLVGAVDATTEFTGVKQLDVVGYCFGGVLALLYAAANPDRVRRLTVMATPIDWSHMGPLVAMTREGRLEPEDLFDGTGNVPASTIKNAFRMLQPTAQVAGYATLLQHLDNDAFVEHYRAITLWTDEHVPFPGACFADMTRLLARDNAMAKGEAAVGGRTLRLADITCPVLCVVTEKDHICPPPAAEPVVSLVGSAQTQLLRVPAGHIGLLVGGSAAKVTLPTLVEFLTAAGAPAPAPAKKQSAKRATAKRSQGARS